MPWKQADRRRFGDPIRKARSRIAQLVEQLTVNQLVPGSSPGSGVEEKPVTVEVSGFPFSLSLSALPAVHPETSPVEAD